MERPERVGAQRQVLALLELRRQRVGQVPRVDERRADQLAQLLRRHVLAGWIDGSEVRRRDDAVQVEGADVESVTPLAGRAGARAFPAGSCRASQGWLNHVAETVPLPSATRALSIFSRPRRRSETETISPAIATSSSPMSAMRRSGAGDSYRRGR